MNYRLLLFGLLFFASAPVVFGASCSDPALWITVPNKLWSIGGAIDVNIVFSADPSPSTSCTCNPGEFCGMEWQTDFNGGWNRIPRSTNAAIDLNCGGGTCSTGFFHPIEDLQYGRAISCIDQNVFHIRGHHPLTGKSTMEVTVYCYPEPGCVPPASGNFTLNQTCNYVAVPLVIAANYTIGPTGHSIHHQSNVIFTSPISDIEDPPKRYLNIVNGGRIDLNHSAISTGLSRTDVGMGLGVILFFGFILFVVRFSHRTTETTA